LGVPLDGDLVHIPPMRYVILPAAILLTACATTPPPQWVKPGGGDQREVYACQMEAEKAAVSSDMNAMVAAFEKAEKRAKVMDLCMRSKGWTLQRM
jgi:hypothetical protein